MPTAASRSERICLIPLTNAVSGTERVVVDIAKALHTRGQSVGVILPEGEPLDRLAQSLRPHTTIVARIGKVTGKVAFGRNLIPVLKFLQTWRPTIVHFHCPHHRWGLDVVLAAHLARIPHLIRTEHNPLMQAPDAGIGLLLRLADHNITTFTYVSQGNQHRYEQLLPYRVGRGLLIRNGIDPSRFTPTSNPDARKQLRTLFGFPASSKLAVYVGSFGDRRSLRPVFAAFRLLLSEEAPDLVRNWRILVIGAGPEDEQAIPAELGITSFVHFAGRHEDVAAILPHCDLFVSASAFEGMSIAILEAWAAGLPVLATQVDGIADVIGDQPWRQFMVPHGDVLRFARMWHTLMHESAAIRTVHAQASTDVRLKFTIARMIESYLQLYGKASDEPSLTHLPTESEVSRVVPLGFESEG